MPSSMLHAKLDLTNNPHKMKLPASSSPAARVAPCTRLHVLGLCLLNAATFPRSADDADLLQPVRFASSLAIHFS